MAGELTCQYRQNHIMRGTLRRMLDMTSTPPAGPHPAPRTPSGQFCYELTVWVGRTATPLASAGHTSAFWQPVPLLPDSPHNWTGDAGCTGLNCINGTCFSCLRNPALPPGRTPPPGRTAPDTLCLSPRKELHVQPCPRGPVSKCSPSSLNSMEGECDGGTETCHPPVHRFNPPVGYGPNGGLACHCGH